MTISSIDARLARLMSLSVPDRCDLLHDLVEMLWGPMCAGDGWSEEELRPLRLPAALHSLYRHAGRHLTSRASQNHLALAEELSTSRRLYVENQGCFLVDLPDAAADPDPYVLWDDRRAPWERGAALPREQRVSEFLVQVLIDQWVITAPARVVGEIDVDTGLHALRAMLHPLPGAPWPWPCDGTFFYYAGGILGFGHRDQEREWLYLGGLSATSFEPLRSVLERNRWDESPFAR